MKKYISYIISILTLLALIACGDSHDSSPVVTRVEPSVIDDFPTDEYILSNSATATDVIFTATWTETLFYLDGASTPTPVAPIEYILQVDKADNEFSNPYILAKTNLLAININTIDFNSLLTDSLKANPNEAIDIEMRLLINYGKNETNYIISKNTVKLSVTPFEYRNPLNPVYIIGDMNGWDNSNVDKMLIMFKDNSLLTNNIYTYTGYMPANCSFKFLPHEALGTDAAYCYKDEGKLEFVENGGINLYNSTEGFKTIIIDLKNLTYSIEDYDASGANTWTILGFIGEFCGWSNEPLMTKLSTKNNHIWQLNYTLPALGDGENHPVKFRAERDWSSRWAAIDPNAVPYGKAIYLTGDEYDPNIVIPEGGNYAITFNDLTGHYVILKK